VTLTPDRPGRQSLLVVAVNGDGLVSGEGDYTIDGGPAVTALDLGPFVVCDVRTDDGGA